MSDNEHSARDGAAQDPTPERWERLRALLDGALEQEASERAAYLDEACAGDSALRAEVEALLESHATPGLIDDFADALSAVPSADDEAQLGRRVGPYRLVAIIGHGGMGAVYLAERADGHFEQRVALKLVRFGLPSGEVVRRFLEERQILARLAHPNIARLLEGGVTEDGQPYFAMEYVAGRTILEYCAANALDVRRRLELFTQICAAVQYAHQNLVVHRDLKPSNILVTDAGRVVLLDFGIAKLLAAGDAADATRTRTGFRWLTPEYASPEQIRGEPVTTASDLYTLGVVLYELLTGQRPYRIPENASALDIERIVCDGFPERPSVVVTRQQDAQSRQLSRRLAGDIDTIVLHALRKEPARRYSSAAQFADDIQQYLARLPVRARPDTLRYRAAKFVQRHRVAMAAAAVVLLTLFGGIAATTWQARNAMEQERIARSERDKARLEAAKAAQVSAFLIDLFKASDPREAQGDSVTAREILERGVTKLDHQLQGQPAVRATLLDVIGRVYRNLGRYDRTEALWRQALDLRRATLAPDDPDVAESLAHMGLHLNMLSRRAEAEPLLQEALDIWTKSLQQENEDVASVLSSLGDVQLMRGQAAAATDFYRRALDTRRRVLGAEHQAVALELDNLGMVLLHSDPAGADTLFRQALAMQKKLLPADHPDIVQSLDGLATVRSLRKDWDGAEALHRETLEMRRRMFGDHHPEVALTLEFLAAIAEKKGDLARAEDQYRQVLDIRNMVFGPDALATAKAMANLGAVLQARGHCAAAEPLLRHALAVRQRKAPKGSPSIAKTQSMLDACKKFHR